MVRLANKIDWGQVPVTRPARYLTRMIVFVFVLVVIAAILNQQLISAFQSNPLLNGLIIVLLIFGIVYAMIQVTRLRPEVAWITSLQNRDTSSAPAHPPILLAPMAAMLGDHQGRMSLSATALSSILDSISSRLDESREFIRYLIGLLIFLGLLGTFWGLLQTVGSVGGTIAGLSIEGGDFAAVFSELKAGLESPLKGMGIAFSSSLFGLASSLILGFLELQAGQAQNRFYNELEEWLSNYTRLSSSISSGDGEASVPVYVQALLEQTADSLANLQRILTRNEENRIASQNALMTLSERLATLADYLQTERGFLIKLSDNQDELKIALHRFAAANEQGSGHALDEASRNHLRNLDVYLMRLFEELGQAREQTIAEVRSEIRLLARTVAAAADSGRNPGGER